MNAFTATPAEERTIIKPPDWAVYMVTAALKCASDEKLPTNHASHDEAKYGILKSLNWFEAHDEYEWPNFASFNYDFSQVMRLRRAFIHDVFNALEKAGNISISIPGTTNGNAGRGRRPRPTNTRKRVCKREAEPDEDASEGRHQDDAFLLDVMRDLTWRAQVDVAGYLHDKEKQDARELANMLHDGLVVVWTEPQQADGGDVELLRQKADAWEGYRKSRPGQGERAATPRGCPVGLDASPHTVQKSMVGVAASTGAAAEHAWVHTHTLD